ncbi:enoyl-CoA hydratase/isomerase family protein [Cupriavidus gilardii]|uniref:enoyl-CoA hydratase/isomerase family protein n=1 Tax=Cupriavidus gilardii TaxID=82541 RepID=UPI001EE5F51E|nr:enoyl-CoA hydratase/isomerase family protein [Cupriavidus gilardii]MCG5260648.1 enoyl-CoA hydratase/isomerase family protein [Cupriavidus gilardii]MDF9431837.1 enoyl-CoA hydratase/isomerase family protein [Cupriavidus gilardii]
MPPQREANATDEVRFEVVNRVGLVTLNRPRQLNALSYPMILALRAQLRQWATEEEIVAVVLRGAGEKAFCAGGDIRALYDSFRAHMGGKGGEDAEPLHRRFFVDEYQLDFELHRYPKPVVALMDGIVMGGGMGLAQAAPLRIVTECSRVAMPETGIGLVPDVGASHFLARMTSELALYVGLTGVTLGAADTLLCGLADVAVDSASLSALETTLADIAWSDHANGNNDNNGNNGNNGDTVLASLRHALAPTSSTTAADAPLLQVLPALLRHFRPDRTPAAILQGLAGEQDPACADWAAKTAALLRGRSPLMTAVTRELLLRGRRLDLADCFRMELDVVSHAFTDGDFIEGVRALIVDKDQTPRWRVASHDQVDAEAVRAFFDSPWQGKRHPLAPPALTS